MTTSKDAQQDLGDGMAPPVTLDRVTRCLKSAGYWSEALPIYANRLQRRAEAWSIAAGLLAAVTSLAIWTDVEEDNLGLASGIALVSAMCALVPRIKNYGEMAGQARELTARYGQLIGRLLDAEAWMKNNTAVDGVVRSVVVDFESVKASKDSLRSLPRREGADQPTIGWWRRLGGKAAEQPAPRTDTSAAMAYSSPEPDPGPPGQHHSTRSADQEGNCFALIISVNAESRTPRIWVPSPYGGNGLPGSYRHRSS